MKQIVSGELPGWKIAEFATNEKIKAREFSYDAQIYLLMPEQLLHLFSLNELVDVSQTYASELSRIRGIVPAKLNTFSHANRTRNPELIKKSFWHVYGMMAQKEPKFVSETRKEPLAKFGARGICAIDSSTILLAYWCISQTRHRQTKTAAKLRRVASVPSRLPHFCVIGRAKGHDSKKGDEPLASLKEGDIGILDRACNAFPALCRHHRLRRVTAHVPVDGKWRDMVFLTNNFDRSATTNAELYKARWEVTLLFKELKPTLQDFHGENENAVKWQVWAALLTHLLLRCLKFKSGANCSYTRFVGLVRAVVGLKKDFLSVLRAYGMAPGGNTGESHDNMPYLRGFEKYFTESEE